MRLRSADPKDAPEIQFNYMSDEKDWADFRNCIRMTREIFNQEAFKAFVGREIVPRVAVSLLDAWDRRTSQPTPSPSDSISAPSAQLPAANASRRGGRRHRRRRGQGRG